MIQRFRPLTSAELAGLEAKLQSAVAAWSSEWLQLPAQLHAVAAVERQLATVDEGRWLGGGEGSAQVQVYVPPGAFDALTRAMLGARPGAGRGPVLEALQRSALAALVQGLTRTAAPLADLAAPVPELFVRGVGTAQAVVGVADATLVLVLARAAVDALAGIAARPARSTTVKALVPRWQAIRHARVRLEVHLDEAGLTVEELRRIRRRDVVRFDHPIARAVGVRVAQGPGIGNSYLGRIAGQKALKLVKSEEAQS